MPVNNFEFEKADGIISSIKGQSVGRDPISAAGIFNFVSIAQKGFGYEPEEEDMIVSLKVKSFEGSVLTFDQKASEIPDLLDNGALIYFYDTEDYFDIGAHLLYFLIGEGPNAGQWIVTNFNPDEGMSPFTLDTDLDGYLYIFFD